VIERLGFESTGLDAFDEIDAQVLSGTERGAGVMRAEYSTGVTPEATPAGRVSERGE